MGLKLFLAIIFSFIIGIILIYFIANSLDYNLRDFFSGQDSAEGTANDKDFDRDFYEDSEEFIPFEDNEISVTGGDGTNEAGGCIERQVPYALKNFRGISICNIFEGDICIDKTVNCTIEVHNLDDNIGGIFKIKFTFFEDQQAFNLLFREDVIEPKNYKIFEEIFNLVSAEENGMANKNITCSINTEIVPKGKICN